MRLFIAVNFSENTVDRLLDLRDIWRSRSRRGNFSWPENLHLTLAFLGECDAQQTAAAKAAMDAVTFQPLPLVIDRIGRFRRDGGDIVWAGVRVDDALTGLHRSLSARLAEAGFKLESRKFNPHVTLGREVALSGQHRFGDITPVIADTVSRIDLMKSERILGKLTYTAIYAKTVDGA